MGPAKDTAPLKQHRLPRESVIGTAHKGGKCSQSPVTSGLFSMLELCLSTVAFRALYQCLCFCEFTKHSMFYKYSRLEMPAYITAKACCGECLSAAPVTLSTLSPSLWALPDVALEIIFHECLNVLNSFMTFPFHGRLALGRARSHTVPQDTASCRCEPGFPG